MHSYVPSIAVHPELFWGRANGWAMLALCDLLEVMPENHPKYQCVLVQYQKFCFGLLKCQGKNGMWHQLLDRSDSFLESSCTAIFVYGFARGINKGWLDNKAYGPSTLLGWNGLSEQINNMGQIENVCVGTGVSYEPAYYYYRNVHVYAAHGFGPVLMAGAEMLTLMDKFEIIQKKSILFHDDKPE
jgi:rhamnogalacturonyl hydrolase YesR